MPLLMRRWLSSNAGSAGALRAWQMVLDDSDARALFARLATMSECNHAVEKREAPGSVLWALAELQRADDEHLRARATRFFAPNA